MAGHVIAVTGGKGGVGKSTTTINLGVSLRMDDYSVALVDADVEMPNLAEMLDVESKQTIHDVLSGSASTRDALVEVGPGFGVIPGDSGLSSYGDTEPERLNQVVDTLAGAFDYVLLDTGAGLSYDDLFPIGLADEIVLVSSPDSAAVENAKRTQAFVQRLNRRIRGVVITMAEGPVDDSLGDRFGSEILAVIPEDPAIRECTSTGRPLEIVAPDSPAAKGFRELEAELTDGTLPPKRRTPEDDSSADGDEAESPDGDSATREAETEPDPTGQDPDRKKPKKPGLVARLARLVS